MREKRKSENPKLTGFYIALCCCVLAIGIAGYFAQNTKVSNTPETNIADNSHASRDDSVSVNEQNGSPFSSSVSEFSDRALSSSDNTTPANETVEYEENTAVSNPENQNTATTAAESIDNNTDIANDYTADNPDLEAAVTANSNPPQFSMPVSGEILSPYSDTLAYSETMGDWRTHNGIDIAAPVGCSVAASAKGIVEEVSENTMGKYVVLSHSGGYTTRYMGLDSVENLTEGKEIKEQEVLGVVGSAKGEDLKDAHLHFEVMKDGRLINPAEIIKSEE